MIEILMFFWFLAYIYKNHPKIKLFIRKDGTIIGREE